MYAKTAKPFWESGGSAHLKKTFPHTLQGIGMTSMVKDILIRVNCIDSVVELTYGVFLDYDKTVNYNIKYVKNYHHTIH